MCRKTTVIIAASVWGLGGCLVAAGGCPYSIRDAGFIVREPQPYKLTVFVNDRTPGREELTRWLAEAADSYLADANVAAEVVNLDQQPHHKANSYLPARGHDNLPVAVLISPRDKAMSLPGLEPNILFEEAIQRLVQEAVVSPKRTELAAHIITDWCVVVVAEGTDAAENRRVAQAVAAASRAVVGTITEMEQKIARGPYVITLSADDAAEEVFAWSIGLDRDDNTQARVAVLYGMGRRVGPVLAGENITESVLTNIFLFLGRNCTCTADPRWLLGPVVPLVWGQDRQQQVYDLLGFDPNSPMVAATLGGVWVSWESLGSPGGDEIADADSAQCSVAPPLSPDYLEFSVETDKATPTKQQRTLHIVVGLIVVLVLIVLGAGGVLLLRASRRA